MCAIIANIEKIKLNNKKTSYKGVNKLTEKRMWALTFWPDLDNANVGSKRVYFKS